MSPSFLRTTSAVMFAFLMSACGEAREPPGTAVRDSAGVRVVENGPLGPSEWTIGEDPLFTVGWAPDDRNLFRLSAGRITPDGGALIGDLSEGRIYRLGPDGTVLGGWGRLGEGPGEYQRIDEIVLLGDSILVMDSRLRRITILSSSGERIATVASPSGTFSPRASSVLPDGRLLFVPSEGYPAAPEVRPEWVFETQPILAAALEGPIDTLADLPHLRRWYGVRGGTPGAIHQKGRAAGFSDGFAWARSDHPEVRWFDGSGQVVQVARWEESPVPATSEWKDDLLRNSEEAYATMGGDQAFVDAALTELEEVLALYDGPLPYWDAFRVDRVGNVWLSEYRGYLDRPSRWRVMARDGTALGWVDLSGFVALIDVTEDRILAVRLDELDVPAVVMLELIRQ